MPYFNVKQGETLSVRIVNQERVHVSIETLSPEDREKFNVIMNQIVQARSWQAGEMIPLTEKLSIVRT